MAAFRDGSQPSFANVTYINYEANGDISGYVDGGGSPGFRSGWETVPLGSKVSTSFVQYDTSGIGTNGQAWSDKRTDQFTYTGETNISEAGTNFDALVFNYRSMYSGTGYESDAEGTSYFAPSIGYFIKSADVPLANGSTSDLVSYTLK